MRHHLITLLLALALIGYAPGLLAQCFGGTSAGTITPTTSFQTINCILGGQYYSFNAIAGTGYMFTMCQGGGSYTGDGQLTILNSAGAYAGVYSDDVCLLSPEIASWIAPSTGTYRILFNDFYCLSGGTCATLAYRVNPAAPLGATCNNAYTIPSLPFMQTGTTCGFGDDYSSLDACNSYYMDGDDFVYAYNSLGNENLSITLSNTLNYTGIFVLNGCPNAPGTVCLPGSAPFGSGCGASGVTNESASGNPYGTWSLVSPGTYYIVISTYPSPQCTPFDINITRSSITQSAVLGGCYAQIPIPYAPENYNQGTNVAFVDDRFSAAIPIGFDFCYLGWTYSDFVISPNGYITFTTVCASQNSAYWTQALPMPTVHSVKNSILLSWQDLDPSVNGRIRYVVLGTAPFRRLVVIFDQVAMFSSPCNSLTFSGQIKLFETTNDIELHIGNKAICPTWNNGNAVQGLVDQFGTAALTTPGRNNTNWTASNEAYYLMLAKLPCCVLDAQYTSLTGRAEGPHNALYWSTSSEEDVTEFVLERSRHGTSFEAVQRQPARGGPNQGVDYTALDPHPFSPVTYYRVRDVGINGQSHLSEVISVATQRLPFSIDYVHAGQDGAVTVGITASDALAGMRLEVLDATGRTIGLQRLALPQGIHEVQVPVSGLSAGFYLLQVTSGTQRKVQKFYVH